MTKCIKRKKRCKNSLFFLEEAFQNGEVKIQRDDGKVFVIKPETTTDSPLDVAGFNLGITTQDILECIHESRRGKRDGHVQFDLR